MAVNIEIHRLTKYSMTMKCSVINMTSISHILSTRLRNYLRVWVKRLQEPEEVVEKSVVLWAQKELLNLQQLCLSTQDPCKS